MLKPQTIIISPRDWKCEYCGSANYKLRINEDGQFSIRCLNTNSRRHREEFTNEEYDENNYWQDPSPEQLGDLLPFFKELRERLGFEKSKPTTNPQPTQEQHMNTPTVTDLKTVFASLTQSMGHGAQVGGAVEARQLILDIFYGSIGGQDKIPTWLIIVPERILAVVFSVVLFVLASVVWTEMPFGKQVAYICRLCWEADGRDIVQPYAARLRLAIEKIGPSLPKPEETRSES